MLLRAVNVVITLTLLGGCVGIPKNSLAPPPAGLQSIILKSPCSVDANPLIGQLTLTLAAGEYRPIGQDKSGVYLVGPAKCLTLSGKNYPSSIKTHCGLLMPLEASGLWYPFEFEDNDAQTIDPWTGKQAGLIDDAIQTSLHARYHVRSRSPIRPEDLTKLQ